MSNTITLLKWLQLNSNLSRRKAFEAIVEGQVRVNTRIINDTHFVLSPGTDTVVLRGKRLKAKNPHAIHAYILFYKPKGIVTSMSDPQGRTTVADFLKKIKTPIFPVGRLDIMTEGLLLLTNDGILANRLLHPSFSVPRFYHVKIKGKISPEALVPLRKGAVKLDGKPIRPVEVETFKTLKKNTWLKVTVREGRKREIRRMFDKLGIPVLNLIRVGFGPLKLQGLEPGHWRELTEREIKRLKHYTRTDNP
jgi:23S rRNA pseudouridine2605 synthase